jgi:hypothetical protein
VAYALLLALDAAGFEQLCGSLRRVAGKHLRGVPHADYKRGGRVMRFIANDIEPVRRLFDSLSMVLPINYLAKPAFRSAEENPMSK